MHAINLLGNKIPLQDSWLYIDVESTNNTMKKRENYAANDRDCAIDNKYAHGEEHLTGLENLISNLKKVIFSTYKVTGTYH